MCPGIFVSRTREKLGRTLEPCMNIHIIKKKILNLINASMNIRRKTLHVKQNIILKTYFALKHIVNRLNDGTYYVNVNFNFCLHNNNLFHIYIYIYIYIYILNEHVHMLGKKTGVLFTISSVNFELKRGKEYRALQLLRILRLSLSPSLSLSS